jgi:hypothetical protein
MPLYKFCILPAEDVWSSKINDRKIANNELKDVEERSPLTFLDKSPTNVSDQS